MTTAAAAYRDPKRPVWLLSLLVPCSVLLGPLLMLYTGDARLLWLQVAFFYLLIPLIDLQRHSDHHALPLRRYQSLRHVDGVPQLPNGYFGMFLVAYIPPLWRHVMDERLLAVVGRDVRHINLDPARRAALIQRYGLTEGGGVVAGPRAQN